MLNIVLVRMCLLLVAVSLGLFLSGCPGGDLSDEALYNLGFDQGYTRDDEYWDGFEDSYDGRPQDSFIEFDELSHRAGLWDGMWVAYHEGYYDCYWYAFIAGFSEGYDRGFRPDWESFLWDDGHPEYDDGSFDDGYNDGFTDGSLFGAADYIEDFESDWLRLLRGWDQGDNVVVTVEGVEFGTEGEVNSSVVLYVDPTVEALGGEDLRTRPRGRENYVFYLNFFPETTERGGVVSDLVTESWLDRVDRYLVSVAS